MTRPARLVLIGSPVAHSLSPTFQNAALESAGLPLRYEALDVAPEAFDRALDELAREGAAGNVTVPHKEPAYRRCTRHTVIAERVAAVNTFWTDAGALCGDNTDVGGFLHALRAVADDRAVARVALLGAGGSAAAVCAAAEELHAREVRIVARGADRARTLAGRFPRVARACESLDDALAGCDVVVNATPLGLRDDDALPAPIESIPRRALVVDLAYRPEETAWVRAARDAGRVAADGLSMLLEQGALSFERWFGFAPDRAAMRRAIRERVGRDR